MCRHLPDQLPVTLVLGSQRFDFFHQDKLFMQVSTEILVRTTGCSSVRSDMLGQNTKVCVQNTVLQLFAFFVCAFVEKSNTPLTKIYEIHNMQIISAASIKIHKVVHFTMQIGMTVFIREQDAYSFGPN